jgi:hypothetical protein
MQAAAADVGKAPTCVAARLDFLAERRSPQDRPLLRRRSRRSHPRHGALDGGAELRLIHRLQPRFNRQASAGKLRKSTLNEHKFPAPAPPAPTADFATSVRSVRAAAKRIEAIETAMPLRRCAPARQRLPLRPAARRDVSARSGATSEAAWLIVERTVGDHDRARRPRAAAAQMTLAADAEARSGRRAIGGASLRLEGKRHVERL